VATTVGQINFGVGLDASGITAELRRALTPALATVQQQLNRRPLTVPLEIDTRAAISGAQRELQRARLSASATLDIDARTSLRNVERQLRSTRFTLNVPVRIDARSALREAERDLQTTTGASITMPVNLDTRFAIANAERDIQRANIRLNIPVDLDTTFAIANARRDLERAGLGPLHVALDLDTAGAIAQARAAREQIESVFRDRITQEIHVDHDSIRRASSESGNLASSLGRVGGMSGSIFGIGAALTAVAGAAGLAAGALGGLLIGALSLGPAVAGIFGTIAVGVQGVGGALSAIGDISANAASEAQAGADATTSAMYGLESAQDSAVSASENLSRANRDAARAAEAVGDAYKQAEIDLRNYELTAREASLSEREAAFALEDAQKDVLKARNPDEHERAILRVEQAELRLIRAQDRTKKAAEENAEAQEKGIENSDAVTEAREKQAQADQQVVAAERQVAAAARQVAQATDALTKAQNTAAPSVDKFNQALAQLSPNAQAFVLAAKDLAPVWDEFTNSIQDNLFASLGDELRETAEVTLPAIKDSMGGVATALNQAAVGAFNFIQSEDGLVLLNSTMEASRGLIDGMTSGTGEMTAGWVNFVETVAPHMENVGSAIASIGEGFGRALTAMKESGQLDAIMVGFADTLRGLGSLVESLMLAFGEMGSQVLPALKPLFESLGDALVAIAPALGEIGAVFANTLTALMPPLSEFIGAFADALVPILPVLKQLLESLGDALTPILPDLANLVNVIGQGLIEIFDALAPALGPLVEAFSSFLRAVSPLLTMVAEIAGALVEALAPALTTIFDALRPVIEQLADAFMPVIEAMAPVLGEVAQILGDALADALKQLAPVLPQLIGSFLQIVEAMLPLLPILAQLIADLLPPLMDVIMAIIPVVLQLSDVMIGLVTFAIRNLLIPAVEFLAPLFTGTFNIIAGVVTWLFEDVIGKAITWVTDTAFPNIKKALEKIPEWFGVAVDGVKWAWDKLMDIAAVPINFVIETVWNNGLLKAWRSIDDLLGGVLPDGGELTPIKRATGGPLSYTHGGSGNGTKDDMLFWGSNNEHVITSQEVINAGGHNVLFAIRDMILRGIPFTWDHGKVISQLGKSNLDRYGSEVRQRGYGNVPPEGLFDQLANVPIPKFRDGGPLIMPWMHQLKAGHDFARAQNGKPYQWAGPNGVGSSFDCSGFMGSIIAAILGDNPWQRYWATSSFAGYPQRGPQGLTRNLFDGSGMAVGITDDPGGPGGGHTAGELRGIPELNIAPARVESGGALGDVHYGRGTDPNSFHSLYGLPIGANGFFQPAPGGSSNGPSVSEQQSLLRTTIEKIVDTVVNPVRDTMNTVIGKPPPQFRGIPVHALDLARDGVVNFATDAVGGLGDLLGGAWQKAQDVGGAILDFVNPFDSGGIANGTGFMPKNVIAPERVLSPEQTQLFEALVQALQGINSTAGQAFGKVVVDLSADSIEALQGPPGVLTAEEIMAESIEGFERTQSSIATEQAVEAQQQRDLLLSVADKLGGDILGPIMSTAVNAGVDFLNGLIEGLGDDVVKAVNGTTQAVNNLDTGGTGVTGTTPPAFGLPGSSFDAASALSEAVVSVANTARQTFEKVGQDIVSAALQQTPSRVGNSRGVLGRDISGGYMVDLIVKLTGVEIEILDTLENTRKEIISFREDSFSAFEASGELVSDTADLVQRNQSSIELQAKESERIQKALMKAVLKYLIVNVLLPIITAVLGAMITLATTAIGAAIGSAIPIIGPLIGAAVGAAIGAALGGLATVFTSVLAVGAGAALDAFDEGGVAHGIGMMPKNTIAPERVLSPRQTAAFESLVPLLDRMTGDAGNRANKTVNIGNMNFTGPNATEKGADSLLSLLNS
jgi:phage-related protein